MICFIDYRATEEEIINLINLGCDPIKVPKCCDVYDAINGHVDIQLNIIDKLNKHIIVQKHIPKDFLNILKLNGIKYTLSKEELGKFYPSNIMLNALILENYFVHNLNYTDENLIKNQGSKISVNVNQGYTKCSVLPIGNNAIITNDKGIYKTMTKENMDVLLIPPGDILLPSLDYGFIGGTGGMISENKLALFGQLEHYCFGNDIYKFLYKYDIEAIPLKRGKLVDRGSLLTL
ncbi:DUF6873 family GME fold protein [Clostridium vincentii]|uniref:DUF6873 domain-containing protein n=1 Tax=Clostridium vincentii TaxID=52704 RepID=A0A2T0BG68_9CLOT|nr:hypothetical protein [Clostridium vincentii]PRR82890.1 hypothetical protein CLVI_13330 [Clostridium vincentii]